MSKFIAFVAALLISTLSFAQQFITFSNKPIEVKEGQLCSKPECSYSFSSEKDTARSYVKIVPAIYATIDLNMSLADILEQGYKIKVWDLSQDNYSQLDTTEYSFMSMSLYKLVDDSVSYYGGIDFAQHDEFGEYLAYNGKVGDHSRWVDKKFEKLSCEFEQ